MNQAKLKREGTKWVADEIITEEQLQEILTRYSKKDPNTIITLFAILLTGLAFLTFIFSDWALVPHFSRTLVIMAFIIILYLLGDFLFRRSSSLLGVSFIVLAYIVFGAGLLLSTSIYNIILFSAWPFVIWSVIGLLLYIIYEHKFLFVIGIGVTTVGQIYSGFEFGSFNWLILLVLLLGFAHFAYHRSNRLFSYLLAISISLQMILLISTKDVQYYWLIIGLLILYLIGSMVPKQSLQIAFKYVSLFSVFIFSIYQTFILQEEYMIKGIEYQFSFFIFWIGLLGLGLWLKSRGNKQIEWIDFILFIPLFYLPYAYVVGLIVLFVFSIISLLMGYRKENNESILIGTIAFLLSTFTVYIQFAWDAMNKSLFFLIGGILLFLISFALEKQRRAILEDLKGGQEK